MATRKKTKPRKRTQPYLGPEVEPPHFPDLDLLADDYHDAKRIRVTKLAAEKEAKQALIDKMNELSLSVYLTPDDLIVTLVGRQNVTCKKKAEQESNGEAEQ